jgi:hypothetical protein
VAHRTAPSTFGAPTPFPVKERNPSISEVGSAGDLATTRWIAVAHTTGIHRVVAIPAVREAPATPASDSGNLFEGLRDQRRVTAEPRRTPQLGRSYTIRADVAVPRPYGRIAGVRYPGILRLVGIRQPGSGPPVVEVAGRLSAQLCGATTALRSAPGACCGLTSRSVGARWIVPRPCRGASAEQ